MAATISAIVLLTLGALNAALAISVGTCTQGSADNLAGGFITLVLYLSGVAALSFSTSRQFALTALLPAIVIAAWHSWFAVKLAYGYYAIGVSACSVIEGIFDPTEAGEWMDGSEPIYVALWMALSVIFWAGVGKVAFGILTQPSDVVEGHFER